jgi:hypothetical protein
MIYYDMKDINDMNVMILKNPKLTPNAGVGGINVFASE